jgi:hypothetical protein
VTPFGNFEASTPFDAIANLDPGDAADGVNASSSAGGGGLLGGLGELFGGGDGSDEAGGLFGDLGSSFVG